MNLIPSPAPIPSTDNLSTGNLPAQGEAPSASRTEATPLTTGRLPTGEMAAAGTPLLPLRLFPTRVVPEKIVVTNPWYARVFDCETYALHEKSVVYGPAQSCVMGRFKKNVTHSFGPKSEWDGTPPLKVFEFLRGFSKACDDNAISEGMAFYMLQDCTKGILRTDIMSVMPSFSSGAAGEVTSYLEVVNWLLRSSAYEASFALQVEEFNHACQVDGEDEMVFAERVRKLNSMCGFLHTQGAVKSRFVEGIHWSVRAEGREHNTARITLAELARLAQRRVEGYRKLREEQRREREADVKSLREEARRSREARDQWRLMKAGVVGAFGGKIPFVPTPSTKPSDGTRTSTGDKCWNCDQVGHWAYACPKLSTRVQQLLRQAGRRDTRPGDRPGAGTRRPRHVGVATSNKGEESPCTSSDKNSSTSSSSEDAKSAGNE